MSSPCCSAPLYISWGGWLCSSCWQPVAFAETKPERDLIAWLMVSRDLFGTPIPQPTQPPRGTRVFYRHGKRLTSADRSRGKPDAWFWIDT